MTTQSRSLRNRRRSLLSGSVVFFGVFFLIFARGFIDGIEYGTVRTQIDSLGVHFDERQHALSAINALTDRIEHVRLVDGTS